MAINILILSCGTRNKIVQYFKKTLYKNGTVVAADCTDTAPALYEADKHYIVPRITEEGYLDAVIEICRKEKITGVISLIDPELSVLAKNEDKFKNEGTSVIGSSYELCEMSFDKIEMYNWLRAHSYKTAKSYENKEEFFEDEKCGRIKFPAIVKPIRGSASNMINIVCDCEKVDFLFKYSEGLMVQEYLDGQEIGADVYIDMISGEVVSIFTKKKLLMKAGETDKAVSFKNEKLFALIEKFVLEAGFKGQIDIDIFEKNGEYYICEVNPRFGGGYPHAYECGADHIKMIVNNLLGIVNEKKIGDYDEGVLMMKYSEVMTIK